MEIIEEEALTSTPHRNNVSMNYFHLFTLPSEFIIVNPFKKQTCKGKISVPCMSYIVFCLCVILWSLAILYSISFFHLCANQRQFQASLYHLPLSTLQHLQHQLILERAWKYMYKLSFVYCLSFIDYIIRRNSYAG